MKIRMARALATWPALALIVVVGSGCGGDSGVKKLTVTGTVSYDGKPIEDGVIVFAFGESVRGGANSTGFIKNGKFSVSGVSPGKNVVTVAANEATTGAPAAAAGGSTNDLMEQRGKMPDMNKGPGAGKKAMGKAPEIPPDAAGNSQTFDIGGKDGTTLDIKILKK